MSNLTLEPKDQRKKLGTVTHTCNPSIWQVVVGKYKVPGQSGLYSESVLQMNKLESRMVRKLAQNHTTKKKKKLKGLEQNIRV